MTPADLVKVKPLEWVGNKARPFDGNSYYFVFKNMRTEMIDSVFGWDDGIGGYDIGVSDNYEDAKAKCQAHYEKEVLDLLEVKP